MSIFDSREERAAVRFRDPFARIPSAAIGPFPVLSALSAGTIGATSLTNATVQTDTFGGTLYMAVVTNGGSATNAQIITGSGGNIVATAVGNAAVISGATQTIASIPGLTTATTYQLLALQVQADLQSSQVSRTFTTA